MGKNVQKLMEWYERFTDGKTSVEDPEGAILRFALVSVELEDRDPERAKYPSFVVHEVAENGLINEQREIQARNAAAEATFGPLFERGGDDNVIPASSKFARRQYENLARWTPTLEQNEAVAPGAAFAGSAVLSWGDRARQCLI